MVALADEYQYYRTHHADLVQQYNDQVIAIRALASGEFRILGPFADELAAIDSAAEEGWDLGQFLVQKVTPDIIVQSFHSRVSFA